MCSTTGRTTSSQPYTSAKGALWAWLFWTSPPIEFLTAEGEADYIDKLLSNFAPKELLVERDKRRRLDEVLTGHYLTFDLDDWVFTREAATDRLLKQFETGSLKGFGIQNMPAAIVASGAILHYLDITKHTNTSHISSVARIEEGIAS